MTKSLTMGEASVTQNGQKYWKNEKQENQQKS